ncbi:MAG: type IV pilin N-terminal domain-containing protein [Methanomassiliicoccales archaeon]
MKKIWKTRRKTEAVSPVIATILMVAITVVLAAVLYVMVMGFGGGSTQTPTGAFSSTRTGSGAYTVTLLSISQNNVQNSTVTIVVTPSGATTKGMYVADASANHYLGAGDYMLLSGLITGSTYTITLKYNPTGNAIASTQITAS